MLNTSAFRANSLIKDGGERRSSRRISISPANDDDDDDVVEPPRAKRLRFSPRNFKHCTDITGLKIENYCSGCVAFKDYGTKAREEYTTVKYQCFEGWKKDANAVRPAMMGHVLAIQDYIQSDLHIAIESFQEESVHDDESIDEQTTMTTPVAPAGPPRKQRHITFELNKVHSQGQHFEFEMPSTHVVIHKNYLSRLEKESDMLRNIRQNCLLYTSDAADE